MRSSTRDGTRLKHLTFRKVRATRNSAGDAVVVTLFRGDGGSICGWYLGPTRFAPEGVTLPYLPRSKNMRASVAVVRAVEAANKAKLDVCIVDPDDLWERAWAA